MKWLGRGIFAKKPSYEQEFANNLYEALVLSGGPSSDSEDRIDSEALNIRLGDLARFSQKRLITLEAFLFVATSSTTSRSEQNPQLPHPLSIEVARLIGRKWAERGIDVDDDFSVGDRCFAEVELALDQPFKWGRAWLEEFYDKEEAGEHYIMWTDQWLKEFQAMRMVVERSVR